MSFSASVLGSGDGGLDAATTVVTDTIGDFRRNLLLNTEAFSAWANNACTVTSNATTAPDGTETADLLTDASASFADRRQDTTTTLTHNAVYCGTVSMKYESANTSEILIQTVDTSIATFLRWDWVAGVPVFNDDGQNGAGVHEFFIRPDIRGNGWYRFEVRITYDNTAGGGNEDIRFVVYPDYESAGSNNGTYVWGGQVEERTTASVYQPQGSTDDWTGDYLTISAWDAARTDPVTDTVIYEGALLDGDHEYEADVLEIDGAQGNTSPTYFRRLTYATQQYVPHTHAGPKIYIKWADNTSAQEGIRFNEDNFQLVGVGVFDENPRDSVGSGSVERSLCTVEKDNFIGLNCFFKCSSSPDASNSAYVMGCMNINGPDVNNKADNAQFFNCVFEGNSYGRGAAIGILFNSFSSNGGVYGCVANSITGGGAGGRGFWALAAADYPERINCISLNCTTNDFDGVWSRYGYCVSSDATADSVIAAGTSYTKDPVTGEEGTAFPGQADEWSFSYVTDRVLLKTIAQDYRPTAQSLAFGSGRNETTVYETALGAGNALDYLGETRLTSGWSIGPFELSATAPSAPTTYTELIGSAVAGRHYETVADWALATQGVSFRTNSEIRIGEIHRDGNLVEDLGANGVLEIKRAVTDKNYYRRLQGSSDWRYNATAAIGASIQGDADDDSQALLNITENFFEGEGFAVIMDNTASTNERYGVRVSGDEVTLDSLLVRAATGTPSSSSACVLVRGARFEGRNLFGLGGINAGAHNGFWAEYAYRPQFYHCCALGITRGTGVGFRQGTDTVRMKISGCVMIYCDLSVTGADLTGVISFSISDDALISSFAGCTGSVSPGTVFESPTTEDVRLISTSIALNSGENLSAKFSTDFNGDLRLAPFDIGIFEGLGSASITFGPAPQQELLSMFQTKLIEIRRKDGQGFYFTDASHAIAYRGRTFLPQNGVDASARRGDAALSESSVEYRGLVNDDSITTADLEAGRFRDAFVKELTIDYRYPWTDPIDEQHYWLGPGSFDDEKWMTDAIGIAHFLDSPVGGTHSVSCPVKFGSPECGKDISDDIYDDVSVLTLGPDTRREFYANTAELGTHADGWFENGEFLWVTGANANTFATVKRSDTGGLFILVEEQGYPIDIGDTFRVVTGCLKRYIEDCITKHDNGPEFRGEPWLVGADDLFETLKTWGN